MRASGALVSGEDDIDLPDSHLTDELSVLTPSLKTGPNGMCVFWGTPQAFAYDVNDRVTSQGATTFAYDEDGNTVSKTDGTGTTLYGYDGQNRLTSIDSPTLGISTYTYDADGLRVSAS